MEPEETTPAAIVRTRRSGSFQPAETMPADPMPRAEAMKALGIGNAALAALVAKGEVRSWPVGKESVYEREEIEAIAERDGKATVLGEAVKLLRQSHAHNADAMRLMMQSAQSFASLSREVVQHLLERNAKLETTIAEQRDVVAHAHESETTQAIAIMEAEGEQERKRALLRAGERAFPILLARLQKNPDGKDAALAAAIRTIAGDKEMVSRLKAGMPAVEAAQVDALVAAASE